MSKLIAGLLLGCPLVGMILAELPEGSLATAARENAQDRTQRLQDDRSELVGEWIYDDMAAGFAEAKKTGKPLMIVFR